jgi:hypothetical protein
MVSLPSASSSDLSFMINPSLSALGLLPGRFHRPVRGEAELGLQLGDRGEGAEAVHAGDGALEPGEAVPAQHAAHLHADARSRSAAALSRHAEEGLDVRGITERRSRRPLVGVPAHETIEIVKPHAGRPLIERAGLARLIDRRVVVLAEPLMFRTCPFLIIAIAS